MQTFNLNKYIEAISEILYKHGFQDLRKGNYPPGFIYIRPTFFKTMKELQLFKKIDKMNTFICKIYDKRK